MDEIKVGIRLEDRRGKKSAQAVSDRVMYQFDPCNGQDWIMGDVEYNPGNEMLFFNAAVMNKKGFAEFADYVTKLVDRSIQKV